MRCTRRGCIDRVREGTRNVRGFFVYRQFSEPTLRRRGSAVDIGGVGRLERRDEGSSEGVGGIVESASLCRDRRGHAVPVERPGELS